LGFLRHAVFEARRTVDRLLAAEPCDVVCLHQPLSGFGALGARRLRGVPALYSFLSPAPLEYASRAGMTAHHRLGLSGRAAQTILWAVERSCIRRAAAIHVLSDFSAGQLWHLYGVPSDRLVRIPGGVDLAKFTPVRDRRLLRSTLGLPADTPLLLTVRNLEARMGLETLIRTMAILRQHVPIVQLLIGGAGSLRSELETLVESLDLGSHVRFLGYVPDAELSSYYQAADVFVLPTRALEGFGLITVEAMACGTPVLGTDVGAIPEILRPLDPSLVFPQATPEGMAERLRKFLAERERDPERGERARRACRQYVESFYGWERAVEEVERTLTGLNGGQRIAPSLPPACPACGAVWKRSGLAYRGSSYLRCPRCGTGRVVTLPSRATLRTRYETEYPDRFAPDRVGEARAAMFSAIVDRVARLKPAARVLDIGCGGGQLLRSTESRGWLPFGADLSGDACAVSTAAGVPAAQADATALPYRDACVDIVFALNLVDHTADPFRVIREAYRVLAPGGLLVIRVPNAAFHRAWVRAWSALGLWARWRGWDRLPILHLFAFPAAGLRHLARRGGFHILEVRNSTLAADGAGRGRLLRLLHGAMASGARAIERLTRGRLLAGPSIELIARRPGGSGDAR
jgi:glycosyltransferase involved in cell wall biosynthesis/SAM-dependent methyltransferase